VRRSGDRVEHPFGEQPVGLLLYTDDGRMSVQLMASDRKQLPSPDQAGRPDADAALTFPPISATAAGKGSVVTRWCNLGRGVLDSELGVDGHPG
jgi:hypothetical protein